MKKLITLVFLAVLMISCSDDCPTESKTNTDLMPLAIGNAWAYKITLNTGTTFEINDVPKDTTINNIKWFVYNLNEKPAVIFSNQSGGLWTYLYNPTTKVVEPELYYKYPASQGENYFVNDSIKVTITSISTPVTVYAGTFNCYLYHSNYNNGEAEYDEYMCPGVGAVKIIEYKNSAVVKTTELEFYTIK